MSTLANFRTWYDDRVRDAAARFTSTQRDDAIQQAVARYGLAKPQEAVTDYIGDGATFDFTLPSGWVSGLSVVRALEYPAGERIPTLLEREDWQLYRTATIQKLRLLRQTPALGKTLRVTWAKPHLVDVNSSSIPSVDEAAVADLAAAIGLRELAAVYAGTVDPALAADSVNYRSKSEEYLRLAKELDARYRTHLGLDKNSEAPAASAFTDVDQQDSLGLDKLTHPNRWR